jgi:hypothetical protein
MAGSKASNSAAVPSPREAESFYAANFQNYLIIRTNPFINRLRGYFSGMRCNTSGFSAVGVDRSSLMQPLNQ